MVNFKALAKCMQDFQCMLDSFCCSVNIRNKFLDIDQKNTLQTVLFMYKLVINELSECSKAGFH